MNKPSNPGRKTVELRPPSRIRREPPPAVPAQKGLSPYPGEREVWTVVIGVTLFAVAIAIIIFAISDYTS